MRLHELYELPYPNYMNYKRFSISYKSAASVDMESLAIKRRRRRTEGSDGETNITVTKMNKLTSSLHAKKRFLLNTLLGGPDPEKCGELTPAEFMEKHQEVRSDIALQFGDIHIQGYLLVVYFMCCSY
jgi:hypothetical protein